MPVTLATRFRRYSRHLALVQALGQAQALLSWDRETYMPVKASTERGTALSLVGGMTHALFTRASFVELVASLHEDRQHLSPEERRAVECTKRSLDKSVRLPKKFVEETEVILNQAHAAWITAKQSNTFAPFAPWLEKVIRNRQEYAQLLAPKAPVYDTLLDDYEEGITSAFLSPLFAQVRTGIQSLLPQILERQSQRTTPVAVFDHADWPRHLLEPVLKALVARIGFDWQAGVLGHVEHPFEITLATQDVRVNTHFESEHHGFTVTGLIHEVGHGLYEQHVAPAYAKFPALAGGVSLGIHESQSRLLENIIGRSLPFWQFALPLFQEKLPGMSSVTPAMVVESLTHVAPTLIRTEADEVTYNLHIIVRAELEQQLLTNTLSVSDLTEAWNEQMRQLLGCAPTQPSQGVLQDVHWSWGNFGYFPTYTLGNLNAAQLWARFVAETPSWESHIAAGDFSAYTTWFRQHVWQYGSMYTPIEVMQRASGQATTASYFLEYLRTRYLP